MPYIFLSWGGPDEQAVMELKRELQTTNYEIWEYKEGTAYGTTIQQNVLQAIHGATAALFCFSDATADRPWISKEIEWAYSAYMGNIKRIIPAWINDHSSNLIPEQIRDLAIPVADLHDNRIFALPALKTLIAEILQALPPIEVPAALLAMDETQSTALAGDLRNDATRAAALRSLCLQFGMTENPPERPLIEAWHLRYRPRREDFSPYADGISILKTVDAAVAGANVIRVHAGKRPISVRWIHQALSRRDASARDWWRSTQPLMVVDSVSTLSGEISNEIGRLPDFSHASLLWIPPFTRRTELAEASLRESVAENPRVEDVFRDWERKAARGAFDSVTSMSAHQWLRRVFFDSTSQDEPRQNNVVSVRQNQPAMNSINAAITPSR
jgi:TIR domain